MKAVATFSNGHRHILDVELSRDPWGGTAAFRPEQLEQQLMRELNARLTDSRIVRLHLLRN